jgi:DNA-binding NarL/FixJ family response regulator
VLRRIKQSSAKCVVIILSNCREPVVRDECQRHGADCFLHKATQFEKVCEVIASSRR